MIVVILLGKNDKYLGNKLFETYMEAELFVESIQDLMIANIEGVHSLKVRLARCSDYFPFAGAVQNICIVDARNKK